MLRAAVEMVALALADEDIGVNVKLKGLPLIAGEATPPDIEVVYTVFDNDAAARFEQPDESRVLVVFPDSAFDVDGEVKQTRQDTETPPGVGIVYSTDQGEMDVARRNGAYMIRAIDRCMSAWLQSANDSMRTLNKVQIPSADSRTMGPMQMEAGRGMMTAGYVIRLNLRNLEPTS